MITPVRDEADEHPPPRREPARADRAARALARRRQRLPGRHARGRRGSWRRGTVDSAPAHATATALGRARRARSCARSIRALAELADPPDVVVNLDADVSFEPDFFERLLDAFAADPTLGIASGTCYELEGGDWRERHVTGSTVWGATRGLPLGVPAAGPSARGAARLGRHRRVQGERVRLANARR